MEITRQKLFCYILNCSYYATLAIAGVLVLSNLTYYRFQHLDTYNPADLNFQHNLEEINLTPETSNVYNTYITEQILSIAKKSCAARKLGEYCTKDMLAIAFAESRFNCQKIGDKGMSFGCYQIHLGYHPNISKEQARDLNFAINWTLNRMVSKGYPKYRSVSLMAHNGTPNSPKTLAYLNLINSYREKYQVN
jgi:hypothetical protein